MTKKKEKQEELFLSERELTIEITYGGEQYQYDIDLKDIIKDHDKMPIDILKGLESVNFRIKDFDNETK